MDGRCEAGQICQEEDEAAKAEASGLHLESAGDQRGSECQSGQRVGDGREACA